MNWETIQKLLKTVHFTSGLLRFVLNLLKVLLLNSPYSDYGMNFYSDMTNYIYVEQ